LGEEKLRTLNADDAIASILVNFNNELAEHLDADVIIVRSPIRFGLDDAVRHVIENLCEEDQRKKKLAVLIETTGGYIEVVERIYSVLRKHYPDHVTFIVPNFAYSAGTVLALSGDEIYMDYYSILGPIDAQFESPDRSGFVPGMGYLAKYDELVDKINSSQNLQAVQAEMAFLIEKFDPAELFKYEQAKAHSESLLKEWLPKHTFKNWKTTKDGGKVVSPQMRENRAGEIAACLGDASRWHSHGRGIGIKELTSDEIKLEINDFGAEDDLNMKLRRYYDLFIDYCLKMGAGSESSVIHSQSRLRRL
jgi:hypothetical protein